MQNTVNLVSSERPIPTLMPADRDATFDLEYEFLRLCPGNHGRQEDWKLVAVLP